MLKREERKLRLALSNLESARDFLLSERIMVCTKQTFASTTLHYVNGQGDICYEIDKEIGSLLVGFYRGISVLREMIGEVSA
jgi:hypothetical protein